MSLTFIKQGDIFKSNAQAVCNAVNCVGVMGAGLAAVFKKRHPDMNTEYVEYCREEILKPGAIFLFAATKHEGNYRFVFNVATKDHWMTDSQYEWIEQGLKEITKLMRELDLKSLAIPALGCGLGGLDWNVVKGMIDKEATRPRMVCGEQVENWSDLHVEVYEPL